MSAVDVSKDDGGRPTRVPTPKSSIAIALSLFLSLILILYGIFTEYDTAYDDVLSFDPNFELKYGWFQDVHIMIFIGFGFLMVYLKHHGFSSVGFNYLVACMTILWSILTNSFFHQLVGFSGNGNFVWNSKYTEPTVLTSDPLVYRVSAGATTYDIGINSSYDAGMDDFYVNPADTHSLHNVKLSIDNIITGDFTAAACLISFGAILGKVNAVQLIVMVFFECIFFAINEAVGANMLQVSDVGGSIFVHLFGAIFGVAMSRVVTTPSQIKQAEKKQVSSTNSDLFAMVGSIFLFCFWPSFNGALASGEGRHRVVINTVISLCGSCLTTFLVSGLVHKERKYLMEHIQNAALAGGVAVGSSADLQIQPWGALILGLLAGVISTLGFARLKGSLENRFKLHDSCGVLHLHGTPALLGAVGGVFSTFSAPVTSPKCNQYSGTAPSWSGITSEMQSTGTVSELHDLWTTGCSPGLGRSLGTQAGFQITATLITIIIAATSGGITGWIMKQSVFTPVIEAFTDRVHWEVEVVEPAAVNNQVVSKSTRTLEIQEV